MESCPACRITKLIEKTTADSVPSNENLKALADSVQVEGEFVVPKINLCAVRLCAFHRDFQEYQKFVALVHVQCMEILFGTKGAATQ